MVTEEQREQIQILQSFLDQGLMDPEDFEEEKKKILSGGSFEDDDEEEKTPSPVSSPVVVKKSSPATVTKPVSNVSSVSSTRKHVIKADDSDSDSSDEPIIQSTKRNVNTTTTPTTTSRPTITKTASPSIRNTKPIEKQPIQYSNSSSDEAAVVISEDDESANSNSDKENLNSMLKVIGGGSGNKKILNSTTTDESDSDSDDEPIISSSKRTTTNTTSSSGAANKSGGSAGAVSSAKVSSSSSSGGFKPNLTQEERNLLSADQIQQLERLANLVDSEILSEDEYVSKKEILLRQQRKLKEEKKVSESSTKSATVSSKKVSNNSVEDQLKKLEDLLEAGILTPEEFKSKKKQLLPDDDDSDDEDNSDEDEDFDSDDSDGKLKLKLTPQQRDQLAKLDSLLQQGILEQDEFDEKKRQVMGLNLGSSKKSSSKILDNKQANNSEFGETMDLAIYISNIKATPEKPFKLKYEGETVMYQREESTPPGKTVIVRGQFPKKPREDCIVSLLIEMPEANIHTQQNFNLTQHGRFIQIVITQEDAAGGNTRNNIRIKQQHDDSFDTNQALGDKNEEMSRIYLHYAGVAASEEKPFRIWINEMMAHQMVESMTSSQSGVIRGSIPKIKRCNPSTDSHHDVKLKVHIPMVDFEEKVYVVNLTDDGEHVQLQLLNQQIVIRQSKSEKIEESNSKLLTPMKTSRK